MNCKEFLIVSAVFPPEPVVSASLSYDLAVELSQNERVIVISPIPSRPFGFEFGETFVSDTFRHYQLKSFTCPESKLFGRLRETYSFGKATYEFICQNHDSISKIYSNTWPLFAQFLTVKAAKKYNIPVTIHVQDIYPESLTNKLPFIGSFLSILLMPIDKYIFKNTSKVIAISETMKQYLAISRKISSDKISVIANWQNEDSFIEHNSKNITNSNQPFTFMYMGNIGPVAGLDLLIEAFAKTFLDNCRLVIAGSGSMKKNLMKKAERYPKANIEFWSVSEGKVQEIQNMAHVMLLPMKKGASGSSIPSKLPAYLFSKKPVIACVDENSDSAFAIKHSDCGWVIPPENVELLVKCMKDVSELSSDQLLLKGNAGFHYAFEKFSKKNNLKKLLDLVAN
jgi:glycosyltransferase involved in cell wall biosynthesis